MTYSFGFVVFSEILNVLRGSSVAFIHHVLVEKSNFLLNSINDILIITFLSLALRNKILLLRKEIKYETVYENN